MAFRDLKAYSVKKSSCRMRTANAYSHTIADSNIVGYHDEFGGLYMVGDNKFIVTEAAFRSVSYLRAKRWMLHQARKVIESLPETLEILHVE